MSNVQYAHKEIMTGMTNYSNLGKVEMCGDSKTVLSYILLSSYHQWLGYLLFCIAIKIIKFLNILKIQYY